MVRMLSLWQQQNTEFKLSSCQYNPFNIISFEYAEITSFQRNYKE